MRRLVFMCTAVLLGMSYTAHGTTIVMFADDFSNGAPDMAVSINDPDPQADPANNPLSANTSLSGTVLSTVGPGSRAWHGDNSGPGTLGGEAGGLVSWTNSNGGTGSGTIAPRFDFALERALQFGRNFTISIDDLNPIVGGNGTSGNWTAISLFRPSLPANGSGVDVNVATVPLGMLLRDNGNYSIFKSGAASPDVVFDLTPATTPEKTYDVDIEVTNISGFGPGNSFDYRLLVDGVELISETITGVDTTHNFIAFETRSGSSIMSGVTITAVVPEPASAILAIIGFVLASLGVRRRRYATANLEVK